MEKTDWTTIQKTIVPILKAGGIGVLPTDTLYGVVGSALKKKTVERIYDVRKRELNKPMIILISSLNDLKIFGIALDQSVKKILDKVWPNKVSIILVCKSKKFSPPQPKKSANGVLLKNKQKSSRYPGLINDFDRCGGKYLHHGKNTLAFRFPNDEQLLQLLKKTGPLVAPSANLAGKEPATTYVEAKEYFAENVDFYVDSGKLKAKPSTLASIDSEGKLKVLREGAVKIKV